MKKVNNTVRATLLVLSGFGLLASCGGGNSTPPAVTPEVTSVAISPSSGEMEFGSVREFTVSVTGKGNFSKEVKWQIECGTKMETLSENVMRIKAADSCAGSLVVQVVSVADTTKTATATLKLVPITQPPTGTDTVSKGNLEKWLQDNVVADTTIVVCGAKVPGDPDNNWKPYPKTAEKVLRSALAEQDTVQARKSGNGEVQLYRFTKAFSALLRSADSTVSAVVFNAPACPDGK